MNIFASTVDRRPVPRRTTNRRPSPPSHLNDEGEKMGFPSRHAGDRVFRRTYALSVVAGKPAELKMCEGLLCIAESANAAESLMKNAD
jgi:hypothetical protein